jgi:hypothetical protein
MLTFAIDAITGYRSASAFMVASRFLLFALLIIGYVVISLSRQGRLMKCSGPEAHLRVA